MTGKISRRDFLRRAGFFSAGIAALGVPALKVVAHASLATDDGRAVLDSLLGVAQGETADPTPSQKDAQKDSLPPENSPLER